MQTVVSHMQMNRTTTYGSRQRCQRCAQYAHRAATCTQTVGLQVRAKPDTSGSGAVGGCAGQLDAVLEPAYSDLAVYKRTGANRSSQLGPGQSCKVTPEHPPPLAQVPFL